MAAYPKPKSQRSGCKVGWLVYAKMSDAKKAQKLARAEADRREAQGYDFGYQVPGTITVTEDGIEVVIP